MKKSIAYKQAQIAVLKDDGLSAVEKLYIVQLLLDDERLAEFIERREAEACQSAEVAQNM